MKRNLVYLLPLLITCFAGCSKDPKTVNYQITPPVGNFSGTFQRWHLSHATGKTDTVTANLYLHLDAAGTFTVTGDTATVHAGSFGTYGLGVGDDLVFKDKTLPPTGTPAKVHLSGSYVNSYSSGNLVLQKTIGDSLFYQYNLNMN
jgi:hypothetical protein